MIQECYMVLPPAGMVIEISERYHCVHFVRGYCRGIALVGGHPVFLEGFRLCPNHSLTLAWAEPCPLDVGLLKGASLVLVQESNWMREKSPLSLDFQREESE
jgi:hypothetical protein